MFEVDRGDGFEEFLTRGVNLGMAKPGRFPGEAAITREEYDRWIQAISDLNANAIRTYTIHPPAFYEALESFNRDATDPIYLLQGTWIGEQRLNEAGDVTKLTSEFYAELRRTVDVVHGEANLDPRPGHASGRYEADVSNYLMGYIAGIEWPPSAVIETNEKGDVEKQDGQYVQTVDGTTFERWLAGCLETVIDHSVTEYDKQHPVAFTNWVTTDPLDHPYEPFHDEDAVSLDPDAIVSTDQFDAGVFAASHVYPYYPDFLNHTPEYVEYVDHRSEPNSYAGYLDDLVDTTDHPLLVAEFGVPESRGIAHKHVHGRDQGRHTEEQQGHIVANMYEDIVRAGAAGGLVFTWQDEWFKRTWNLAPLSERNRRPYWSNRQTPEQRFGLLGFDPAGRVSLDGSAEDWTDATRFSPTRPPVALGTADAQRTLTSMAVTHDEAYLSVRLEFESLAELDWSEMNVIVALGHSGRGNTSLPLGTDVSVRPTDFLIHLAGPTNSRVRVDAYYDPFARLYGSEAGLDLSADREQDSGRFTPVRMTLNRRYTVPPTGEEVPFEAVETGRLRYGNGNPEAEAYDSLADVHVSTESDVIELRIPWLLLNVADPSSRLALGDLWKEGVERYEPFDSIATAAGTYAPGVDESARRTDSQTNLTHAIPGVAGNQLKFGEYRWETWTQPEYVERKKDSYDIVQAAFDEH